MLARLREQAQQQAKDETVDLPVAGYKDPELVARYRFMGVDETDPIGERIRSQYDSDTDRILHAGIQTIAEACEGIYTREKGSPDLAPLDLGDGGSVPTFEPRLADAFGISHQSASDIVLGVFKGNPYAVVAHATQLQVWMADTSRKVIGSLGER